MANQAADEATRRLDEALQILDGADDMEVRVRNGETLRIDGGSPVRGEEALPIIEVYRRTGDQPLAMASALNLQRIADALETLAERLPVEGGTWSGLGGFTDAEMLTELAERAARRSDPGA